METSKPTSVDSFFATQQLDMLQTVMMENPMMLNEITAKFLKQKNVDPSSIFMLGSAPQADTTGAAIVISFITSDNILSLEKETKKDLRWFISKIRANQLNEEMQNNFASKVTKVSIPIIDIINELPPHIKAKFSKKNRSYNAITNILVNKGGLENGSSYRSLFESTTKRTPKTNNE